MTTRFRHSDLHQVIFNENMLKRLCQEVDSVQCFFSSRIFRWKFDTICIQVGWKLWGCLLIFFAAQLIKFDESKVDLLNFGQVKFLIKSKSNCVVYFKIRIQCSKMRGVLHSFLCRKLALHYPHIIRVFVLWFPVLCWKLTLISHVLLPSSSLCLLSHLFSSVHLGLINERLLVYLGLCWSTCILLLVFRIWTFNIRVNQVYSGRTKGIHSLMFQIGEVSLWYHICNALWRTFYTAPLVVPTWLFLHPLSQLLTKSTSLSRDITLLTQEHVQHLILIQNYEGVVLPPISFTTFFFPCRAVFALTVCLCGWPCCSGGSG